MHISRACMENLCLEEISNQMDKINCTRGQRNGTVGTSTAKACSMHTDTSPHEALHHLLQQPVPDTLSPIIVCTWLLVHEEWRKSGICWFKIWAEPCLHQKPMIWGLPSFTFTLVHIKVDLRNWGKSPKENSTHTSRKKFSSLNSNLIIFSARFFEKRGSYYSHPFLYSLLRAGATGVFAYC